jgi:hypothetical protein
MIKAEGGHKRGHSNMNHWDLTAEIKKAASTSRRQLDKRLVAEGLKETQQKKEKNNE